MKKKILDKNRGTKLFLMAAMLGLAGFVILMNILFLPAIHREFPIELPELAEWRYLLMFSIVAASVSFFVALGQIFRLLNLIERNKAFSASSVRTMQNVKYCAFLISGLFALCMPVIFMLADADDAPGLIILFGFIYIAVPLMVGVFAGVAQRLFQNAIDIKSENDLTV